MKTNRNIALILCVASLFRTAAAETEFSTPIAVRFSDNSAEVAGTLDSSVVVTRHNAHVTISSTKPGVNYILSGPSLNGSLEVISTHPFQLTLNGVELSNCDGPAIEITSGAPCRIETAPETENRLCDAPDYSKKMEAALTSTGPLIFGGSGTLIVAGRGAKQHAICSDKDIFVESGRIQIISAAKDGIHGSENFQMNGGTLRVASEKDGLDITGAVDIHGGQLIITSGATDVSAIKCAHYLQQGGAAEITVSGDRSKALKTDEDCEITGGTLALTLSGSVQLQEMTNGTKAYTDPAYCKALDCEGNLLVSGGTITVKHTGLAGKGLCVDGNAEITGGTLDLEMTGGCSEKYTNEDYEADLAAADAFKMDGNLIVCGGTIRVLSKGNAGDGITAKGNITIGSPDADGAPTIAVTVRGAQVLISDQQAPEQLAFGPGAGFGQRRGGPGGNQNASNPKALQAQKNLVINSGNIRITTTKEGAEGIESKQSLTINGGTVEVSAFDDGINAAEQIIINGGSIYSYSDRNDGIDSNGSIEINGGVVVTSGTTMPEEGLDCDHNPLTINGGIVISTGGASSMPSENSRQPVLIYSGEGVANSILQIKSGTNSLLTYRIPRTYAAGGDQRTGPGGVRPEPPEGFEAPEGFEPRNAFGSRRGPPGGGFGQGSGPMTLLFSSPDIGRDAPLSILSGGTVSGGTEFHGLLFDANASGGTLIRTLPSSANTALTKAL